MRQTAPANKERNPASKWGSGLPWGYIEAILGFTGLRVTCGLHRGYSGIMENEMETTIIYYLGFRAYDLGCTASGYGFRA